MFTSLKNLSNHHYLAFNCTKGNVTFIIYLTWICFMAEHAFEKLSVTIVTYMDLYKYTFFIQVLKFNT